MLKAVQKLEVEIKSFHLAVKSSLNKSGAVMEVQQGEKPVLHPLKLVSSKIVHLLVLPLFPQALLFTCMTSDSIFS